MALIKCSECQNDISDKAHSCPRCGHPMTVIPTEKAPVTIELTKKKWKKTRLWAIGFLVIAGFCFLNGQGGFGGLFLVIAIIIAIVANIGSWWSNG